jgi:hypothetical protein
LPVVLCECQSWSLTFKEGLRLRLFENRVLRRILWCNRDEVTGERRKPLSEKLNDLISPYIVQMIKSRRMRWTGHVARKEERGVCRLLVRKREKRGH